MKKYFLIAFVFLVFSQSASAVEDISGISNIEPSCNFTRTEGSFIQKSECSGAKKDLYYIDEIEVTKAEFEKKKAFYDINGELCDETRKSKLNELPEGFSISCTKGKYGKYYVSGKKVTYADFILQIFGSAFVQAMSDSSAQLGVELKKQQKELSSYKKFLTANQDPENIFYASFPQKGQECTYDGSSKLTMNGEGSKTTCVDGVITEVEYYFADKAVSFEVYTKKKYKILKSANIKALKNWKKEQGK